MVLVLVLKIGQVPTAALIHQAGTMQMAILVRSMPWATIVQHMATISPECKDKPQIKPAVHVGYGEKFPAFPAHSHHRAIVQIRLAAAGATPCARSMYAVRHDSMCRCLCEFYFATGMTWDEQRTKDTVTAVHRWWLLDG